MAKDAKRRALVNSLKRVTSEMQKTLKDLERWGKAEQKRPDFVWHILLQSFATWGGARGAEGLINTPDNYGRVTFDRLSALSKSKRDEALRRTFRKAGIRWPEAKAVLMARNYGLVKDMGGLEEARKEALASRGRDAKIRFMKRFHGIGDKYARNIWMDVYHRDFHDAIAVDERIKKITKALGYSFKRTEYDEHERFYQDIAEEAGLQGWELDRLLFNFTDHFLTVISASKAEEHRAGDQGQEGDTEVTRSPGPSATKTGAFNLANSADRNTLEESRHLIHQYLDARESLKELGILRSGRTLQGDFAEWLVARFLGLELSESAVEKGVDATGPEGETYQIKSRVVPALSARTSFDLSDPDFLFDYLVAVFFNPELEVLGMLRIPRGVVIELGSQTRSTFRLYWRGESSLDTRMERLFWKDEGVE